MSFLDDFLLDIILEGFVPESSNARLILFGLIGLACAGTVGWILLTSPDPANEPPWSFSVLMFSAVYGSIAAPLSGLYAATTDDSDRKAAIFCFASSTAAMAVSYGWFLS